MQKSTITAAGGAFEEGKAAAQVRQLSPMVSQLQFGAPQLADLALGRVPYH